MGLCFGSIVPARSAGLPARSRVHYDQQLQILRGLSALAVIYAHLIPLRGLAEHVLQRGQIAFLERLVAGHVAVGLFFVLSGYVLAERGYQSVPALRLVLARYMRLIFPVLVATLACIVVVQLGLLDFSAIRQTFHLRLETTPWSALVDPWRGIVDCVVGLVITIRDETFEPRLYDPVAWTMSIEFWGSLFVFAAARIRMPLLQSALCAIVASATLFDNEIVHLFACFAIGALASFHKDRLLSLLGRFDVRAGILAVAVLMTIALVSDREIPIACGAWFLVALAQRARPITGPISRFAARCGDASMSIYLLHMPLWGIVLTVTARYAAPAWPWIAGSTLRTATPTLVVQTALYWTIALVLYTAALAASVYLFHRFVDLTALRWHRRLITSGAASFKAGEPVHGSEPA